MVEGGVAAVGEHGDLGLLKDRGDGRGLPSRAQGPGEVRGGCESLRGRRDSVSRVTPVVNGQAASPVTEHAPCLVDQQGGRVTAGDLLGSERGVRAGVGGETAKGKGARLAASPAGRAPAPLAAAGD